MLFSFYCIISIDVPILSFNIVSATATCNGIMVDEYIDNDIELLLILKDSLNVTVFSETVRTLPYLINSTVNNLAGDSKRKECFSF